MVSRIVCILTAIFVHLGVLVRKYPNLVAADTTVSHEREMLGEVKGLTARLCRAFCIRGLLIILTYYLLFWGGMAEMAAGMVS